MKGTSREENDRFMDTQTHSDQVGTSLQSAGSDVKISISSTKHFPVTPYTRFFLRHLPRMEGRDVLDFGSGCGTLAIAAASLGARSVVACDVAAEALSLVRRNALANNISNVETALVDTGNELSGLGERSFDIILCNPSSLPTPEGHEGFWVGGPDGTRMIRALTRVSAVALRPAGSLNMVHTSLAALAQTLKLFRDHQMSAGILAVEKLAFRPFYDVLLPYFQDLRSKGIIYFTGQTIEDSHEYLYLIHSQHAAGLEAFK